MLLYVVFCGWPVMCAAIGPPKMARKISTMITMPPPSAALSWRKRSQKSRLGVLRVTATGWSATAPPAVT